LPAGDLAVVIISAALLLLVLMLALPLIKLARLIDETTRTVQIFNNELEPMLGEAKTTLTEANKQLKRIDHITSDVEQVTENINSLVAVFTSSVGAPLSKLMGVVQSFTSILGKRR